MPRAERHESKHEIDQLEQNWRDAILHRNVQAMDALLADDYIAITANGTLQSKDQALANLKSGALHFSSIDFSDRKVRFYGQTALVTSRAEVKGTTSEGDLTGSYRYTRVYVRDPQGRMEDRELRGQPDSGYRRPKVADDCPALGQVAVL